MAAKEYRIALQKAEEELSDMEERYRQLGLDIARRKEAITSLRNVIDPDAADGTPGLTDSIRNVLKGAVRPLKPTEIRDQIVKLGQLAESKNTMASVHPVLARLHAGREATEVVTPGGMKYYWWTANGEPPPMTLPVSPKMVAVDTNVLSSLQEALAAMKSAGTMADFGKDLGPLMQEALRSYKMNTKGIGELLARLKAQGLLK